VLAEKGINVEIVNVSEDQSAAADLAELNPYNEAPTLVDRDLVLYDAGVINDYLDERYPHPPLMPVDPVSRAQLRLVHHRILRDWYSKARIIESSSGKKAEQAAKQLREEIISANELFAMSNYVLSDELSLVDCTLGPLLWRLTHYGVKLGKPGASVEFLQGQPDPGRARPGPGRLSEAVATGGDVIQQALPAAGALPVDRR